MLLAEVLYPIGWGTEGQGTTGLGQVDRQGEVRYGEVAQMLWVGYG